MEVATGRDIDVGAALSACTGCASAGTHDELQVRDLAHALRLVSAVLPGDEVADRHRRRHPETGLVLPAQQHVSTLLANDACARPAALAELKQLYALAWRVLQGLHTVADRAPEVVRTALAEYYRN
ncbi:hypothetical protein [Streptomyces mirabilis]|uniref:hypothetical protein n=1 Tax=Streptomyces mirabilis TaxID=68239 RepID=UPI0033A48DFB